MQTKLDTPDLIRIKVRSNSPSSKELIEELKECGYDVLQVKVRPHRIGG